MHLQAHVARLVHRHLTRVHPHPYPKPELRHRQLRIRRRVQCRPTRSGNATKNASPAVSTSTPPCAAHASRHTRWCSTATPTALRPSSSSSAVEPSMSVNRNVTVPRGRSCSCRQLTSRDRVSLRAPQADTRAVRRVDSLSSRASGPVDRGRAVERTGRSHVRARDGASHRALRHVWAPARIELAHAVWEGFPRSPASQVASRACSRSCSACAAGAAGPTRRPAGSVHEKGEPDVLGVDREAAPNRACRRSRADGSRAQHSLASSRADASRPR